MTLHGSFLRGGGSESFVRFFSRFVKNILGWGSGVTINGDNVFLFIKTEV